MPSEHMMELIRETLAALEGQERDALVPIKDAWPHFLSRSNAHKENGWVQLFPVDIAGERYYVYLKGEHHDRPE